MPPLPGLQDQVQAEQDARRKAPATAPEEEGAVEDWSSYDDQEMLAECLELVSQFSRVGMPTGSSKWPEETLEDAMPQQLKRCRTTVSKRVVMKSLASRGSLPEVRALELVVMHCET